MAAERKRIWVRAVKRHGLYEMLDRDGNKIPESLHLHYTAEEVSRGDLAGRPFEILEEDFSPIRKVNGIEIGWMERVDGGPNDLPKKAPIATAAEADASPRPIPHIRREKSKKLPQSAAAVAIADLKEKQNASNI